MVLLFCLLFFFFFFKQKTAYEMRISDWSSDVCSSDLLLDVLDNNPTLTFIRACIWAGLRSSDDNITTTEAGEIIDEIGVLPATGALIQAVTAAFPTIKGKDGGKHPPKGQAGTGTNS